MTEVGDIVERYTRRYLNRTKHRGYQVANAVDCNSPVVVADNFQLSESFLTLDITAYVPHHFGDLGFFFYKGTMRLSFTHYKSGLHAHVISLKERPRGHDED